MKLKIIHKQESVPEINQDSIKIKFVDVLEDEEITNETIEWLCENITKVKMVLLSLEEYGEDNWLEVLCSNGWIALGYHNDEKGNFYSYNEKYAGCDELAPVPGQSPVEKYLALEDIELGIQCVKYFIYTGQLYPGIDWAKQI